MPRLILSLATCLLAAAALGGCAPEAPVPRSAGEGVPADEGGPLGSPFVDRRAGLSNLSFPLIVDREDLRLGVTVQYGRMPTVAELNDLRSLPGARRLVLALNAWPADALALETLTQTPPELELWVILPGYPPTQAAAEAWAQLGLPARIVVVVPGPPPSIAAAQDLNRMRNLERVIAQMDEPDRLGFERVQVPLSFRTLRE